MGYFNIDGGAIQKESKWQGKVWNVIGDSNTEANAQASQKYHDILQQDLGFGTVNNYGLSGTGWYTDWLEGGAQYVPFHQRLDQLDLNADLITVLGGGNDYRDNVPVGVLGDTDPTVSFYGAIDYTLKTLIEMYPDKTIAVFTQFRRSGAVPVGQVTTDRLDAMVKAQLDVTFKYGIPCLNLYHNANQYPWLESYKAAEMPDGVHLNNAGQEKLAHKMKTFIENI